MWNFIKSLFNEEVKTNIPKKSIYFDYTKDFENIEIEVVNERFINNINDMMNYRDGIVISVASELDYWSKDDLLNEIETRIESLEAEERFYTSL